MSPPGFPRTQTASVWLAKPKREAIYCQQPPGSRYEGRAPPEAPFTTHRVLTARKPNEYANSTGLHQQIDFSPPSCVETRRKEDGKPTICGSVQYQVKQGTLQVHLENFDPCKAFVKSLPRPTTCGWLKTWSGNGASSIGRRNNSWFQRSPKVRSSAPNRHPTEESSAAVGCSDCCLT